MSIKKLIWHKSFANFKNFLNEAFKNNTSQNVTFVLDDDTTQMAHKFIICAASPLIKDILVNSYDDQISIHIDGYKSKVVRCLIELIYTGECFIENDEAIEVNNLAILLQIENIEEIKNETTELENSEGEVSASVRLQNDNTQVMEDGAVKLDNSEVKNDIKNDDVPKSEQGTMKFIK